MTRQTRQESHDMGMVYLIHFHAPYKHAAHYLGFVRGGQAELTRRLDRHRAGNGARLMAVIAAAGITWELARVWAGMERADERKLKKRKGAGRFCPVCKKKAETA